MKLRCDNTSGVTGVNWRPKSQKWRAYIKIKGKQYHLGNFEDKAEAIRVRKRVEKEKVLPAPT